MHVFLCVYAYGDLVPNYSAFWGFPGGLVSKNSSKRHRVQSLGQGDPLEEEMATHSNILAWRIPWTEEPGRLQSMNLYESDTT